MKYASLRTALPALALVFALGLVSPASTHAAAADFTGGPVVTDLSTVIANDHTPVAIRFAASGLTPDMQYEVKVRLSPVPSPSGTDNRGFTWNPTTSEWVRNRGPAWAAGNYPVVTADSSGSVTDSGWLFFTFANDAESGMYYVIVTINDLDGVADGDAQNASEKPLVRVLDMDTEGVWVHNGTTAVANVSSAKRVVISASTSVDNTTDIYSIIRSELNLLDDDSNGIVDDEDYGMTGAIGDYRLAVPADATVDVWVQTTCKVNDYSLSSANPGEDIALGASDTAAPSAPANLVAEPGETSAVLTWDASSDDTGVTAYRVYRWIAVSSVEYTPAHVLVDTTTGTTFEDTGLTPGVSYSYEVRAADAATNVSAHSAIAVAAIPLPTNNAPVAVDDAYSTGQNTQLVVDAASGLVANDTDADDDVLTAVGVTDPAHGTVDLNFDGSFTYTPDNAWSGTDSFTYQASDGLDLSAVATVQITVTPEVTIEDKAAGVTFDRFVPSVGAAYSGGTYIYGRWTGTRIESRFTGTKIEWYGPKQPGYGMADVYIDNVKVATVDCYAPSGSATVSTKLWESATLGAGSHTISIRLMGAKNAASAGNIVVVDKLVASGTGAGNPQSRVNESAGAFTGAWIPTASTTYTDGTYRYSRWAGAKISYAFTGTKVAWIGPRALNYGRADVYIDGVKKATVSQYGVLGWRYRVWESATLAAGQHTIEIRVLGTKEAASANTIIVVDGFDVTP